MTLSQEMRVEGIRASLETRGHTLTFGAVSFEALIEPISPEGFDLNPADTEQTQAMVSVLRADYPNLGAKVGSTFSGVSQKYRVTRVRDEDPDVLIRYQCATVRE